MTEPSEVNRVRIVEIWEPVGPDEFGPLLIAGVPHKLVRREVVDDLQPVAPLDDE